MIKKTVMGVCGLVLYSALAIPAFADQSTGYQEYFKEGVQAFNEHDDQKALRCFKIAQIYDPNDEEVNKYLSMLKRRAGALESSSFASSTRQSTGYEYYLSEAIKAFQANNKSDAIRYFGIARAFNPDSKEVARYLEILGQAPQALQPKPEYVEVPQVQVVAGAVQASPAIRQAPSMATGGAVNISVGPQSTKKPAVLSLAQLTASGDIKPKVQITYHSSVIITGQNIHRFLVTQEGYISVKMIDADHLEVDAFAIGTTFLHIWDDSGMHTLYIEIIFPVSINAAAAQAARNTEHSQPFTVTYSNDWDSYYSGKDLSALKRQSYQFNQTLGLNGETPYGFVDASGSYIDFDSFSEFDTYTIGLSQIPLDGTSDFNLRGFDALRSLSPLTMPSTRLRGAFADVDLLGNIVGLSVSHGQEQVPLGFLSVGGQGTQFNKAYIDAAKIIFFPKSETDRYSFNFATGYGQERQLYLTNHVYSVEGQHKFNDFLTLNAEQGSDSSHDATLASLRWQKEGFGTNLSFRNIDKDYSTISTLPAYQGETGAVWTTEGDSEKFRESTFLETYRNRLDVNPSNSSAYNYDANGQFRWNFNSDLWSDTNINYVNTPGQFSPIRSLGLSERLSRSFGIWDSLKGTVFAGPNYQNNHAADSNLSNFHREGLIAGVQLPLTSHLSSFANYEYDWLHQSYSGGNSGPNVVNTGLNYQRQVTQKLSFNSQVSYHDELGVNSSGNGFLSGEQSVIFSTGFNYTPAPDLNIFADGNASRVLSHIGNPAYDDFEFHIGMRIVFGGSTYWDPQGTVTGIVFKDRSGVGKFSPGDEAVGGVKLKVGDKEVVTDNNGRYRTQVRAKWVDVAPDLDTVPGGLIFSTPQSLHIRVFQGRTSRADFGFISQTGIYGIVFVDNTATGVPNDKDTFVGKVKITLDGKDSQISDSHGSFYFRKVLPGPHTISIVLNTLPINMVPLIKLSTKIDVVEGTNYTFYVPVKVKEALGGGD